MADIAAANVPIATAEDLARRDSLLWSFIKDQPLGFAGLLVIALYFVLAVGAHWIAPFNPEEIDFAAMLSAPSREHLFGTDQYGRDVFSRLVFGARTALSVGIFSAVIGSTLGLLLGAASGFFGGRIDNLIQRVVDIMLAFPIIVLAMVVVAVLGKRVMFGRMWRSTMRRLPKPAALAASM